MILRTAVFCVLTSAGVAAAQSCVPALAPYVFCAEDGAWSAVPSPEPGLVVFSGRHGVGRIWRSDTELRGAELADFFTAGFAQFENQLRHEDDSARGGVTISLTATSDDVAHGTPLIATMFEDAGGIVVVETIYPNQFDVPGAAIVNPLMVNIHRQFVAGLRNADD